MHEPRPATPREPTLSIVVPMYNEAEVLDLFFARLCPVLDELLGDLGRGYEIVCVDDGSRDETAAGLRRHRDGNPAIKIVSLSRNFGKDIALTAGLDFAGGAAVIPIDADLQDPPELIPALFAKWLEGHDVVYATRGSRASDSAAKRLTARWFYNLYNKIAAVKIPRNTGDFRLMDRRVIEAIRMLPEQHRFMKGLFTWVGFKQTGLDYEREERQAGETKWRYWRLWNFALDGITSSTTLPLRIWTYVGCGVSALSFLYAGFLMSRTLIHGADLPGYASLMVCVLFMGGINLIGLGILGEYLGRTSDEAKRRPLYLISDLEGFEAGVAATPATHRAARPAARPDLGRQRESGQRRAGTAG